MNGLVFSKQDINNVRGQMILLLCCSSHSDILDSMFVEALQLAMDTIFGRLSINVKAKTIANYLNKRFSCR